MEIPFNIKQNAFFVILKQFSGARNRLTQEWTFKKPLFVGHFGSKINFIKKLGSFTF